jgi:tetratricopeptide (TPR) repeat protein
MKTRDFRPTFFVLIFLLNFGCINDSEDTKVKELESIIMQTGVMHGDLEIQKINHSSKQAIALFEDIENKEILKTETYKVIGVLYLYSGKLDKALMSLDRYIKKFPDDGKVLFYKGIILKQKNMDYCKYFKRAQELGFEFNMEIKFTWELENDPCI